MVYTLTLNPALDYVMKVDKLVYGEINRSSEEGLCYGGKGINVSVILTRLGVENTALGFTAGFTGEKLESMLARDGIVSDFVRLESGSTRINVKIKSDKELDINAAGPYVGDKDVEALMEKLDRAVGGDVIVLAGSVPKSLPADIYERTMGRLAGRGVLFAVDATGELLLNTLRYKPFLIKPNHLELGELFGVTLSGEDEIVRYAKKLREMGAVNVLVSRSEDGAILLDGDGAVHVAGNLPGVMVSSVGCGDSMVAGFIAGYTERKNYRHALRLGTACGNATAFTDGLASAGSIRDAFDKLGH